MASLISFDVEYNMTGNESDPCIACKINSVNLHYTLLSFQRNILSCCYAVNRQEGCL